MDLFSDRITRAAHTLVFMESRTGHANIMMFMQKRWCLFWQKSLWKANCTNDDYYADFYGKHQNCRVSSLWSQTIIIALYGKLFATIMIPMGFTIGNIIYSACPVWLSIGFICFICSFCCKTASTYKLVMTEVWNQSNDYFPVCRSLASFEEA